MRVFLTGGTGLIGSTLIPELLADHHTVLGLARSEASAQSLIAAGAEVHYGDLQDIPAVLDGVKKADAVIHCAFDHDFSKFKGSSDTDKRVIEAFGEALVGSERRLLISTGIPLDSPVRPITEDVEIPANGPTPRVSEQTAMELRAQGVNVSVIRLPQVHNARKYGLVSFLADIARQKGVSAYADEGRNRWSAAHVSDVAHLYALALVSKQPAPRYHAVAEEGVSLVEIAEALGARLNLPVMSISQEEAEAHFGFFGRLVVRDLSASSTVTQRGLGWHPAGPRLLDDLGQTLIEMQAGGAQSGKCEAPPGTGSIAVPGLKCASECEHFNKHSVGMFNQPSPVFGAVIRELLGDALLQTGSYRGLFPTRRC